MKDWETSENKRLKLILLLYFFSGFSSLIYEVVWVRIFSLSFGVTGFAVATVLAAFMLGLSLGGRFFGKFIDRHHNPIRVFAYLEMGLGLYALALPYFIELLNAVYINVYHRYNPTFLEISLIRFVLSVIVLLLPTAMMGGTLPVLSKIFITRFNSLGRNISYLYGINILGAVGGCFTAGFFLISYLGVRGTNYFALVMNLLIAAVALTGDKIEHAKVSPSSIGTSEQMELDFAEERSGYFSYLLLGIVFVSGFAAITYELVWMRVISLIVTNTVYAFSIMLCTYLLGLCAGSILAARFIDRWKNLTLWLGVLEILIALYCLFSIPIFSKVAPYFFKVSREWEVFASTWGIRVAWVFGVCVLIMIIPTISMGASFPLICKLYEAEKHNSTDPGSLIPSHIGTDIGILYAGNTLGCVLGTLVVGFFLVPYIGIKETLIIAILINFCLGAMLFGFAPQIKLTRKWVLIIAVFILLGASSPLFSYDITFKKLAIATHPQEKIIYHREDAQSLVEVYQNQKTGVKTLVLNREHKEGDNSPVSILSQRKQAFIPLLLHPHPKQVLWIGVGTGISIGGVGNFPLQKADCVEISSGVIGALDLFSTENLNILHNPRINIIESDGRNFALLTSNKYDVIITDLFTPYCAGVGNLYALEHYEQCRRKLNPQGIMCQWLPLNELPPSSLKIIINTFRNVFPHTSLWLKRYNVALIGTQNPLEIDYPELVRRFQGEKIVEDLVALGFDEPLDFLSSFLMGKDKVYDYAGHVPLNSDNHPLVEFNVPQNFHFSHKEQVYCSNLKELSIYRENILPYLKNVRIPELFETKFMPYYEARSNVIRGVILRSEDRYQEAIKEFYSAWSKNPREVEAKTSLMSYLILQGNQLIKNGLIEQAEVVHKEALRVASSSFYARYNLAGIYYNQGRFDDAIKELKEILKNYPQSSDVQEKLEIIQAELKRN